FLAEPQTGVRAQVTFSVTCYSRFLADLTLDLSESGSSLG
ncbi:28705_t:CDS:1, partial [Dentiscutata erythropus]